MLVPAGRIVILPRISGGIPVNIHGLGEDPIVIAAGIPRLRTGQGKGEKVALADDGRRAEVNGHQVTGVISGLVEARQIGGVQGDGRQRHAKRSV